MYYIEQFVRNSIIGAKAINKTAKADDGLGSFELQKRK